MYPRTLMVNGLRVTLCKYHPMSYHIMAEGYGWKISFPFFTTTDETIIKRRMDKACDLVRTLDVLPKPHPQNQLF